MLAYATVRAADFAGVVASVGAAGALFLAAALARGWAGSIVWALLLLAAAYAGSLEAAGGGVDGAAPLVAGGMLLCGELAAWSLDERRRIASEDALQPRRAAALSLLVLAGLGAAALVVATASAPAVHGAAWTTLGAAATVAVVGGVVALARRGAGAA